MITDDDLNALEAMTNHAIDCAFIVEDWPIEYRRDVQKLIAEVRRLREENGQLQEKVEDRRMEDRERADQY